MNKKKTNQTKFSNDKVLTDQVLSIAAELIDSDIQKEIQEHENRDIEIPSELDQKFLHFMRDVDITRKTDSRKKRLHSFSRFVAIFLVCIISAGAISLGISDAFRKKVFSIFTNSNSGSVTLLNEDDKKLLGSWDGFWYPAYMPKDYELIGTEENGHFLLYYNTEEKIEVRISDEKPETITSIDTDTSAYDKLEIGIFDGYIFIDNKYNSITIILNTSNSILRLDFDGTQDKSLAIKIAKNLEYIKKN